MESDSKYSKLAKNSAVFLVGNLGSKIISFVIVPFYTYMLTTAEYGEADLVTTTVNLVVPFAMLGMNEGVLRFSASRELSHDELASNSMLVVVASVALSWLLYPLLSCVSIIGANIVPFLLLLNLQTFNNIFLQYLRGSGKSKAFAANGIITTFVMAVANVVALPVLHLGVFGYLASMVLAQLVGTVHIVVCSRVWEHFSLASVDRRVLSTMLRYSIPLIPNSLMWWVMSVSDRYVILFFLGAGANGLYNVAQKIPSIVNVVYSIFMQAWQVSAIEERDSEDNARFQSQVFGYMFVVLALASSLIAATAHPVYTVLMSSDYVDSWQPVAMLALANLLSCIGMFFGTTYVVHKESKKAFSTTAVGAVVNIIVTLCLVPFVGIVGAAVATAISYGVMAAVRVRDTKRHVAIEYRKGEIIPAFLIIGLQVVLSFAPYSVTVLGIQVALFFVLVFALRRSLDKIFSVAAGIFGKRVAGRR